jgi:tRNA(fMet)-specific endonuclease VapC
MKVIMWASINNPSEITLSSITVTELFYGAEKSKARKKNWAVVENFVSNFDIVAFDEKSCQTYVKMRASLEKSGTPIGPMDLLIASICLANNFIVVTNNIKEFKNTSRRSG